MMMRALVLVSVLVAWSCGPSDRFDDPDPDAAPPGADAAVDVDPLPPGPELRLTHDGAFSSNAFGNAQGIVVEGPVVGAVWFDERDGNREIYFKRSIDGGTTWDDDLRLTANPGASLFPAIAASDAFVHVVWEDHRDGNPEVYYKRSDSDGVAWGPDVRLTSNGAASFQPAIATAGDAVHVVWFDNRDGNFEIYYRRSLDGGSNWGPPTRLTTAADDSILAAISVVGATVHVVWEDHRDDGGGEIYYKRSDNGGDSFGPDVRLTTNAAASFSPSIAGSGDSVHVVWFDERDGNREIYHLRSTAAGASWSTATRLTRDGGASHFPTVGAHAGVVHVAWIEERDGNLEIYDKLSRDDGAAWSDDVRITFDPFRSTEPSVFVSATAVHLLWTDARDGFVTGEYDGNYEMYYRRLAR